MDLKTQRRIEEYKRKQREKRVVQRNLAGHSDKIAQAERRRTQKLKRAQKKRPGFGSSVPSVADHLNEVVGLTERKISRRELRDHRIEAAAKSGAGVRRHNAFSSNSSNSNKGLASKLGQRLGGSRSASNSLSTYNPKALAMASSSQDQRAKIAKAREAFLEKLIQQEKQHEDAPST